MAVTEGGERDVVFLGINRAVVKGSGTMLQGSTRNPLMTEGAGGGKRNVLGLCPFVG
ncbi:MAG: hypothetical protein NNA20_01220 [Nitrospira sp.]|nr:hypothetical protein [Nitrospira sp.]MCP9441188.1 hypothetical protein [Nitrospira sp.]